MKCLYRSYTQFSSKLCIFILDCVYSSIHLSATRSDSPVTVQLTNIVTCRLEDKVALVAGQTNQMVLI